MRFKEAEQFLGTENLYHIFYVVINRLSNKVYFGVHSSEQIYDAYLGSGLAIKNVIKKYGIENFYRINLVYFETPELGFDFEGLVVDEDLVRSGTTYNLTPGGRGFPPGKLHPYYGKPEENPMYGKVGALKGVKGPDHPRYGNPGHMLGKKGSLAPAYNRPVSEEARRKRSESMKNYPRKSCIYCGRDDIYVGVYAQYHGEKCKMKGINNE